MNLKRHGITASTSTAPSLAAEERKERSSSDAKIQTMPFSIEQYKRKLHVRAAQANKRGFKTPLGGADFVFHGLQKQYLDFCVEKTMDPDHKLLATLKTRSFVLQLDSFADEELSLHMDFLQKTTALHQIVLSLGAATVQRDVKKKFERLGITKSSAFQKDAAASIIRAACAACTKSPNLVRLELRGVQITEALAPLLSRALAKCDHLEVVNFSGTKLGDNGLEAVAIPLAKRPRLLYLNLSTCKLSERSKEDLAKIITVHGTLRDERAWSASLRGATPLSTASRPSLLVDLSQNALSDATAEVLCSTLYHDKWVLGLNLSHNSMSAKGLQQLCDTILHSNFTLAVLEVTEQNASNGHGFKRGDSSNDSSSRTECESLIQAIGALIAKRLRYLQQLSAESSERRLFLCNLLLEWHVDRDIVLQLCNTEQSEIGAASAASRPDNNQEVEYATSQPRSLQSADSTHMQTIKFLVDRLSALEAEQSKTNEYVARLEEENRLLREQAKWAREQNHAAPALEENVIAQLEDSITVLTKQIEMLEIERGA